MLNSYSECRDYFLRCAEAYCIPVEPHVLYGHKGPDREELATHVAYLGSSEAPNVIVISSGIHGVELPIGSTLQGLWLYAARDICKQRDDIRFVFAHALNPFGAAHGLRTDQNNVDQNRNFIDFNNPPKTSEDYRALSNAFAPVDLRLTTLAGAWMQMLIFRRKYGDEKFVQALSGGQYEFADGLYYGGSEPSWTRKTWQTIVQQHVINKQLKNLWHIDIHSGLGPYGELQLLVSTEKDSTLHERVKPLAPAETIQFTSATFAALSGDIVDSWTQPSIRERCTVTPLAIEIGTSKYKGLDTLHAMITRNALKVRYGDEHPAKEKIIQRMRNAFTPQDDKWMENAAERGCQIWDRLIRSVTAPRL